MTDDVIFVVGAVVVERVVVALTTMTVVLGVVLVVVTTVMVLGSFVALVVSVVAFTAASAFLAVGFSVLVIFGPGFFLSCFGNAGSEALTFFGFSSFLFGFLVGLSFQLC